MRRSATDGRNRFERTARVGAIGRSVLRVLGLFLFVAAPGVFPAGDAAAQVQVCIEPADTTVALGDLVTVRVTTDGPPADLKGYLLRATHDPAVLSLVSTDPGSVLDSYLYTFFPYVAAPDTIGFDAAVLIGSTAGPGTLGTFTFQATAIGICDLVPTEVLMRDSSNQPFSVSLCAGRVRVIGVTPRKDSTWGSVKAGLLRLLDR